MKKLLELEQELRKAKDDLNKIMSSNTSMAGSVNSTGGSSLASQIGFGKAEDKKLVGDQKELDQDKDGDIEADDLAALRAKKKMKKAEHEDEKEDKKMIAEAMDEHNEKKHGEKKSKDSAFKEMGLKKAAPTKPANPTEGQKQQFVDSVVNQARQPAKVTNAAGETSMVSPEEQVQAQKDSAASKKAKFEAEAAARRAKMKLNKSEEISYLENGQWSLEKARVLSFPSGNVLADMGQPKQTTPPAGKLREAGTRPHVPSSTEEAAVAPVSSMPKKDRALPYYPSGEHFRGYSNTSKDTHEGYGKDPADLRRRKILSGRQVSSRDHLPDDSQ